LLLSGGSRAAGNRWSVHSGQQDRGSSAGSRLNPVARLEIHPEPPSARVEIDAAHLGLDDEPARLTWIRAETGDLMF
jgi:hypothetical protein